MQVKIDDAAKRPIIGLKQGGSMSGVIGRGGVALAGLATSVAVAIGVTIMSATTGFDPFSLMIRGFIPAGAIACGALAASGYFFAARQMQVPATKLLALQMFVIAVLTQLLVYLLGWAFTSIDGVPAHTLSFGAYVDHLLTTAHELVSINHHEFDTGESGGDGYIYAGIEFIGLLVGGGWIFFGLVDQPTCPACGNYLKTVASRRDGFSNLDDFLDYYEHEFDHPVDSPEFAQFVGPRRKARLGQTAIEFFTKVRACTGCAVQTVDETVMTRASGQWGEAIDLSRSIDMPPGLDVAPVYRG